MPLAQYMHHALGSDHAVTVMLQRLADANLSSATKRKQQEEQKLLEVGTVELGLPIAGLCSAEGGLPNRHLLSLTVQSTFRWPCLAAPSPPPSLGSAVLLRGRGGRRSSMCNVICFLQHCHISFVTSSLSKFCTPGAELACCLSTIEDHACAQCH